MNKLLITGLAVGQEAGVCSACNFHMDWLIKHPSVLLWADSIVVTERIWEMIIGARSFPDYPEVSKACKIVFEIAKDRNIIEITKPTPLLLPNLEKVILMQVGKDLEKIIRTFPDKIKYQEKKRTNEEKKESCFLFINGHKYCHSYLGSIYASLILAKAIEANCLFDPISLNYLKHKCFAETFSEESKVGRIESFTNLFEANFPNEPIIDVFNEEERCVSCTKLKSCKDGYLKEVETRTFDLFRLREYDEIQQIKAVHNKIIAKRDSGSIIDPAEIIKEFREEQFKLTKLTRSVFPKVKRWAKVSTILSIPLIVAGLTTDASLLKVAGVTVGGLAQTANLYIEILKSKYQWLGFLPQQEIQSPGKKEKNESA